MKAFLKAQFNCPVPIYGAHRCSFPGSQNDGTLMVMDLKLFADPQMQNAKKITFNIYQPWLGCDLRVKLRVIYA